MKIKFILLSLLVIILFFPISNLMGLQGENEVIAVITNTSDSFTKVSLILQNKCVDCHAPGMLRKPFYAELPIAKPLMEKDMQQGSARLSLSKTLFSGEEVFTPLMLARLEHVVRNGSMPPTQYLSMHWTDSLSADEKQILLAWIAEERAKLPWSVDAAPAFKGEPLPTLPLAVDLDLDKVALGNKLFHERLLSGDDTLNCASCHDLTRGGTDQAKVSTGIRGQQGPINSPTVYNAMYNIAQFWDGRAKDLQEQAAGPVANPLEMGAQWDEVVEKLKQVSEYQAAFEKIYPQQGLNKATVTDAIAVFEQSLVTGNSRIDQYLRGNTTILTKDELEGYELFKTNCASCHAGPALGGLSYEKMGVKRNYFTQRGSVQTAVDNGRFNVTHQEADRYLFKVPVLRNIELTYPYFHDGSVLSLADAVRIMGEVQLDKTFTNEEIAKMVAFLGTLTGEYKGKPLAHLTAADIQ
ncbi:cytochrome c peroxidase [Methylotuvimicrobium alcaliphilum]|uniref:Cytochrome c peroxidase n=1 Tax=Methylotuvimicrobium alcaliphilum (strain DSM 19304 / NCIMB 14124 / VKM B-2133 / 20Z) TaxID=1091494 RepID=G4T4G6_META2|nr:cytochrome c peroxidase [Methylotuvimicrobium alcaliphilum]CCE25722.1 cytochrome c peroxidase [Methylotuvimicrobium alcaliphilum 20Z]